MIPRHVAYEVMQSCRLDVISRRTAEFDAQKGQTSAKARCLEGELGTFLS